MKLVLSKNAIKFLKKIPVKDSEKVKTKIRYLLDLAEKTSSVKSEDLDIKSLKGDLHGFSRIRVGKIRVVFTVDWEYGELLIHDIDFR